MTERRLAVAMARWRALEAREQKWRSAPKTRQRIKSFYQRFSTGKGPSQADVRYWVDVMSAAANYGPAAPMDSLLSADVYATAVRKREPF